MTVDFSAWNEPFDKLRYKHDTWYIFRDWLDLTIDNFTVPDREPLFRNKDKYTEQEYGWLSDMFVAYLNIMKEALEEKPYYDFLGEWWEGDQNMTNKFKAQYFTPTDVADLMVQLTLPSEDDKNRKTMYDCCCGSGRFGLAYHHYRPWDYFFFNDMDEYAVKMCIVNMLMHGMQGVVAQMNTLTEKVFQCWRVTPYLFEFGGILYVVPYGDNLDAALEFLPSESIVEKPVDNAVVNDANLTGLDKWLKGGTT